MQDESPITHRLSGQLPIRTSVFLPDVPAATGRVASVHLTRVLIISKEDTVREGRGSNRRWRSLQYFVKSLTTGTHQQARLLSVGMRPLGSGARSMSPPGPPPSVPAACLQLMCGPIWWFTGRPRCFKKLNSL